MKLCISKDDGAELVLAEQVGKEWKPTATLAADMAAFLKDADPEKFELWVEDDEDEDDD
jgi:hypothetical protein